MQPTEAAAVQRTVRNTPSGLPSISLDGADPVFTAELSGCKEALACCL
jgi:hypothetical protein